ncbi:MAG: flagellar hook-associated protein FlgK [Actinobacteria bacterium 69-20]|jgi:flagellar hook-associated protein 1 FlgK|nr:flagellar hook-associated protein FlgK [Actinomycetota bacterium]OJV28800.1 MAG: flagellar hook-associated protein FlgK [Actinobacteria bacterium 69-20]
MTNLFAGIYGANDALTAARYGLDVTGQNIANANTPGYTRQMSRQAAVGTAVGVPTIHSGTVENGGVRATGADRLNDPILDIRARDEHAKSASVDTNAARFTDIENIFHEPSDNGLAEQLHDFWNAWGDVANNPGAQVPREMLIQSGQATVTTLHSMDSALDSVAAAAKNSLDAQVTSANAAAGDLSELNRKIAIGNATGVNVNALLDQRDVLLDKLSSTVGGVAKIYDNGTASVTVGGQDLVKVGAGGTPPFQAQQLTASMTVTDPTHVAVDFAVAGTSVTLSDSTAAAEAKTLTDTVPKYRGQLDDVAKALHDTVNGLQGSGYQLDGTSGPDMFTGTTASSITVDPAFTWKNVAASGAPSASGNLDGGNALTAAKAGSLGTSPDTAYSSLVGDLGRASASAKQQQTTQGVIASSVDTLRASASGVSYDEEVSNMMTFQMAFQASSRVLTTLDSMLDTLINHTGLVGQA